VVEPPEARGAGGELVAAAVLIATVLVEVAVILANHWRCPLDAFLRVNPDVQQLKTMHDKDAARMQNFKDVPDALVRSVRAPTLIVLGDQDIVKPEHAIELTRLIAGARLLILPGGHGDYLGEAVVTQKDSRYPELTARLIEELLDSR
jgi:pimeloyl-ACP methyl ester carboxylesterase